MSAENRASLRVAPFLVDVTPPVGHPIAYGVNRKVDSPLYVRGVVLDDGAGRAVLAAVDFIFLWGGAHRQWRRLLGRAAGAPPARVLVHAVHQHDSVLPAPEMDALLRAHGFAGYLDPAYWARISGELADAVRRAVRPGRRGAWRAVAALATAERRAARLASNRRLVGPDGKVWAMRFSMCSDPKLQRQPVGKIDPLLRTIGFVSRGGGLIATLHFYGSHPTCSYRRDRVGSDVPGAALRRLEKATGGEGVHVYFTGCGADVTFGKYTYARKARSLAVLGRRLGEAMVANVRALEPQARAPLAFAHARFELPLNRACTATAHRRGLKAAGSRQLANFHARRLVLLRKWKQWRRPRISRLSLGPAVHVLSLPGECVVEYQLYAQRLLPEHFVGCAAYGEGHYFYLPTAAMYAEGGYEPTRGVYTPAIERSIKGAIERVLAGLR